MYCEAAAKLINEAKRTQGLEQLPVFQDELVRSVLQETKELQKVIEEAETRNQQAAEQGEFVPGAEQGEMYAAHLALRRNKRCLLGYERLRAERLDQLVWDNKEVSVDNYHEEEYFKQYNGIVVDYKNHFPEIDLSGSLVPPKDVFIDVRVLKDAGEIQTEYGVFNLTKDSQFFVRKADVERLIQQGYLQRI